MNGLEQLILELGIFDTGAPSPVKTGDSVLFEEILLALLSPQVIRPQNLPQPESLNQSSIEGKSLKLLILSPIEENPQKLTEGAQVQAEKELLQAPIREILNPDPNPNSDPETLPPKAPPQKEAMVLNPTLPDPLPEEKQTPSLPPMVRKPLREPQLPNSPANPQKPATTDTPLDLLQKNLAETVRTTPPEEMQKTNLMPRDKAIPPEETNFQLPPPVKRAERETEAKLPREVLPAPEESSESSPLQKASRNPQILAAKGSVMEQQAPRPIAEHSPKQPKEVRTDNQQVNHYQTFTHQLHEEELQVREVQGPIRREIPDTSPRGEVRTLNIKVEDAHLNFRFHERQISVEVRAKNALENYITFLDTGKLQRNLQAIGVSLETLRVNGSDLIPRSSRTYRRDLRDRDIIDRNERVNPKADHNSFNSSGLNLLL